MLYFLWSGKKEKDVIPLMKWTNLDLLKILGGWGLKDLNFFGKDLVAKSCWRMMNVSGLWGKLMRSKYLNQRSVEVSIKMENKMIKGHQICGLVW